MIDLLFCSTTAFRFRSSSAKLLHSVAAMLNQAFRAAWRRWKTLSLHYSAVPDSISSEWCCLVTVYLSGNALVLINAFTPCRAGPVIACAPVWSRSAHTSQVDVQLNSTMRLISGTLHSTPLPWLPVLSNIEPPPLRRKAATDKLVEKIVKQDSWSIQPDILSPPLLRLTSRKPLWLDLQPDDIKSRCRHN